MAGAAGQLLNRFPRAPLCVTAAACSAALYLATLAPTVTSEDSGELVAAAYHFGVPHPPGYPVWTMLCGLWIKLFPAGAVAWRGNLFSALCSSLSTVPLCAALLWLGWHRSAALAASLVWAASGTLWSQSVITEVYGLNALFCALLVYCAVRWERSRGTRWLCIAAAVFGLGMGNHHTIAFVAVALAAWVVLLEPRLLRRWKLVAGSVGLFAAGLAPYAYLPIRATAQTPMNWGDPSTPRAFLEHVSRSQYGSTAPLRVSERRSPGRLAAQIAYVSGVVSEDLSLPLAVAAVAGLIALVLRRHNAGLLVILLLMCCGLLFLVISNIDLDRTFRFAMRVFFIPLSLALVLPLGFVLHGLAGWTARYGRRTALLGTAVVLAMPLLPVAQNWKRCDYSNYWYAEDHARNLLASMLPGALIFPSGDHNTFPLLYLTLVEGVRPDVTVADKYGYVDPVVLRSLAEQTGDAASLSGEQSKIGWIIRRARRPAYYTTKSRPPVDNASFVPVGIVYHLLPRGRTLDRDGPWAEIEYRNLQGRPSAQDLGAAHIVSDYHFFRGLYLLHRNEQAAALEHFAECAAQVEGIKECPNNVGSALAEHGLEEEAVAYFEQARQADRAYLTPRWNLARLYRRQGDWVRAETLLHEILRITPQDPRPHAELGFLAQELKKDPAIARHWWQQSLRLDPDQPQIQEALRRTAVRP